MPHTDTDPTSDEPADDFVPGTDTAPTDGQAGGADDAAPPAPSTCRPSKRSAARHTAASASSADTTNHFVPDTDTDTEPTADADTADDVVPDADTEPTADADAAADDVVPDTDTANAAASGAEDVVEVGGLGGSGTTFVPRDWLDHAGLTDPKRDLTCDHDTGGLIHGDVPPAMARGQARSRTQHRARERAKETARTVEGNAEEVIDFSESYRVPDPMARLVRLRDGSCRFPGCSMPAVKCDLDHVRPWPTGPTSPTNLMCLCRRHHRIKQRTGWTAKLHRDATVTWTDPTGLTRTTWPVDHLHLVTAGHTHREPTWAGHAATTTTGDTEYPSTFEEHLIELLGGPDQAQPRTHPISFDMFGNTYGGPPPHVDYDSGHGPRTGTEPGSVLVLDIPRPDPQGPEHIPF